MKIQAQGGVNFVPICVPEICYLVFELKPEELFFKKNLAILSKSSLAIFLS